MPPDATATHHKNKARPRNQYGVCIKRLTLCKLFHTFCMKVLSGVVMSVLMWAVLALAAGFAALWIAGRRVMPKPLPLPDGVELPATPMQRTARWSLAGGVLFGATATVILAVYGPDYVYDSDGVRLVFTLLVLCSILIPGIATIHLHRRAKAGSEAMDERDRAILDRAPAMQALATLVNLAVWVIGLSERFHNAGAVPMFYLYLLFWACLFMYVIGLPAGILIGYRRR
jgi:hypothetical protein